MMSSSDHRDINLRWRRNKILSRVLNVHRVKGQVNKPKLRVNQVSPLTGLVPLQSKVHLPWRDACF